MNSFPKVRVADIVVQEFANEVLIYDLKTNKAFCLNETSAMIWQICDGKKDISQIIKFISEKLNSPVNDDLIWLALNQLKKEKLLENGDELPDYFAGRSRREVIKKLGLSCLAALPIIATVTSPTAAQSNSTCIPLGACTCNMLGFLNGENCSSNDCMTNMTNCVCGNLMNCSMGNAICNGSCQVP